jgi:cytosine/adenosine deaminase-related metal-dependent hydrolase
VQTDTPYIVHLAEGIDAETAQEMDGLIEHDAVGRCTLIIHGIALRPSDMERLHQAGSSVCWCPSSNLFLYDRTANVRALVDAGVNVTLGTDSTMTGGLNLLDEARTGRQAYRQMYGEDPSPQWLVELMTIHAAYALRLEDRRGRIAAGYDADLLVLPDKGQDPYATLIDTEPGDIALLIHGGIPVYGDVAYRDLFEQFSPAFSSVLVSGVHKLVAGDLPGLLERVADNATKPVEFPFLPCAPAEGSV